MRYWLLATAMMASAAWADPSLFDQLSSGDRMMPLAMMEQVESEHPGIIAGFSLDLLDGELRYEFDVINPADNSVTELNFRATDGKLVLQRVGKLEADDQDELAAVRLLERKHVSFSHLVRLAAANHPGELLEAQLEHDLDISYLEFKMMDDQGQRKYAFDIHKLKPLPMLQWD